MKKQRTMHKKNFRPWGNFTNIEKGISWQVKKLEIKPKCSISLQLHNHRSDIGKAKELKSIRKFEDTFWSTNHQPMVVLKLRVSKVINVGFSCHTL